MSIKLVALVSTILLCNVICAPVSIPQWLGADQYTPSSENNMKSYVENMFNGIFGIQDTNTNVFQQAIENMFSYFKQFMQFDMFGMNSSSTTPSLAGPPVLPLFPSPSEVLIPPTPAPMPSPPTPDIFKTIQDETEKFLNFFSSM